MIVILGISTGILVSLALILLCEKIKDHYRSWKISKRETKDRDEYYWKRKQEMIEKLIDFWAHR